MIIIIITIITININVVVHHYHHHYPRYEYHYGFTRESSATFPYCTWRGYNIWPPGYWYIGKCLYLTHQSQGFPLLTHHLGRAIQQATPALSISSTV